MGDIGRTKNDILDNIFLLSLLMPSQQCQCTDSNSAFIWKRLLIFICDRSVREWISNCTLGQREVHPAFKSCVTTVPMSLLVGTAATWINLIWSDSGKMSHLNKYKRYYGPGRECMLCYSCNSWPLYTH